MELKQRPEVPSTSCQDKRELTLGPRTLRGVHRSRDYIPCRTGSRNLRAGSRCSLDGLECSALLGEFPDGRLTSSRSLLMAEELRVELIVHTHSKRTKA
jgi:hypothetical protein